LLHDVVRRKRQRQPEGYELKTVARVHRPRAPTEHAGISSQASSAP